MLNISEECEEYGIIFKDRDQWWARKEINGERNQNRIEEEGRELEIEGVWWRVKEHLGEIKEGTIWFMGISERGIAWLVGWSRWTDNWSNGRITWGAQKRLRPLIHSTAPDKLKLLRLVKITSRAGYPIFESVWTSSITSDLEGIVWVCSHPPGRARTMLSRVKIGSSYQLPLRIWM